MARKNDQVLDGAELRSRAEEHLAEKNGTAHSSETGEYPLRLLHELQVHQIELEMQNEGLLQTREALEEALERYTDLYDFSPVGYVTLDRSGAILSVNLTGAGLLGVERSRLIGRNFENFLPEENRFQFFEFLGRVFASQTNQACELSLPKAGHLPLFVQVEALVAASGQECRIALIDKTEHKRVVESLRREKASSDALRQAKEAAEMTDQAKSIFLANMSHELRTPMTSILAMLQLTLAEELSPLLREYQETSLNSARSLLRILDNILDMAKIEAGKLSIEEGPFSITECVFGVVDSITPDVHRKGLDINLSVADEIPATVVGDQMRLRQVLTNLIGNAVKFTEVGKVVVKVVSGATTPDGKQEFTFSVADTGIGICDDKKELLFRAFSQVDASHSRTHGGSGLGLSICRNIVELMGGTISFTSEYGTGSTYSFTLPLRVVELENAAVIISPDCKPASGEGRGPRILLAEDDPGNRKAFAALFRMSNIKYEIAADGLEAIKLWEKGDFDLVLMDVQMPGLDGLEATRAIREIERERGCHTSIVALTANAFKDDKEKCLAAGMDGYITKPIDIDRLLLLIRGIINQ
jgi:PAS domain S-box-containing protein